MNREEFITANEDAENDVVKNALRRDSDLLNKHDALGNSVLNIACWQNNLELVKLFISLGCDVNSRGDMGRTPLHYAIHCGDADSVEIIKVLTAAGALKTAKDAAGYTPLEWARIELFGFDALPEIEKLLA